MLDCCHSGHGMDFPYTLHLDPYHPLGALWNCDPHVNQAAADVLDTVPNLVVIIDHRGFPKTVE